MDIKTLEYMEARAKKARDIVTTIELLKKNIEKVSGSGMVTFSDHYGNFYFKHKGSIANELSHAYIQIVKNQISSLEEQLAEL